VEKKGVRGKSSKKKGGNLTPLTTISGQAESILEGREIQKKGKVGKTEKNS